MPAQKRASWQACPVPKTSLQKLKYIKVCSDFLAASMRQEKKGDPRRDIDTMSHSLPAVLYRGTWKGPAETSHAAAVHIKPTALADWGYHELVSLSCAACDMSLKSGKFPRSSLVWNHSPRPILPLCSQCGKFTLRDTPSSQTFSRKY